MLSYRNRYIYSQGAAIVFLLSFFQVSKSGPAALGIAPGAAGANMYPPLGDCESGRSISYTTDNQSKTLHFGSEKTLL